MKPTSKVIRNYMGILYCEDGSIWGYEGYGNFKCFKEATNNKQ